MIRTAWSTAAGIRSDELAAVDVISATLARIAEFGAGLNAFTVVAAETALERAAEVDRGERLGLLAGAPISVKDHIWVRGLPATNGSRSLAGFVAAEDCACVARLVEAGAIIVGKTKRLSAVSCAGWKSSSPPSSSGPTASLAGTAPRPAAHPAGPNPATARKDEEEPGRQPSRPGNSPNCGGTHHHARALADHARRSLGIGA